MRAENAACKQANAASATVELDGTRKPSRTVAPAVTEVAYQVAYSNGRHKVDAFEPISQEDVAALEATICGDDYDGLEQQQATQRLARLESDRQLIEHLTRRGFTGPAQQLFEAELATYGFPVMMAWTRTGEIIRRVAEMGRSLGIRDTGPEWSHDDRSELSVETVAHALVFFRNKVLRTGRWDAGQGATIKTYFVGACLFQFPNVYQRWAGERRRWSAQHVMILDNPDDPEGFRQIPGDDDLEFRVMTNHELEEIMAELAERDEILHRIAELRLKGYSDAEAAREVGLSARAVEGRWYRFKTDVRRRHNDAR